MIMYYFCFVLFFFFGQFQTLESWQHITKKVEAWLMPPNSQVSKKFSIQILKGFFLKYSMIFKCIQLIL
jgi:hypothetical protein